MRWVDVFSEQKSAFKNGTGVWKRTSITTIGALIVTYMILGVPYHSFKYNIPPNTKTVLIAEASVPPMQSRTRWCSRLPGEK